MELKDQLLLVSLILLPHNSKVKTQFSVGPLGDTGEKVSMLFEPDCLDSDRRYVPPEPKHKFLFEVLARFQEVLRSIEEEQKAIKYSLLKPSLALVANNRKLR